MHPKIDGCTCTWCTRANEAPDSLNHFKLQVVQGRFLNISTYASVCQDVQPPLARVHRVHVHPSILGCTRPENIPQYMVHPSWKQFPVYGGMVHPSCRLPKGAPVIPINALQSIWHKLSLGCTLAFNYCYRLNPSKMDFRAFIGRTKYADQIYIISRKHLNTKISKESCTWFRVITVHPSFFISKEVEVTWPCPNSSGGECTFIDMFKTRIREIIHGGKFDIQFISGFSWIRTRYPSCPRRRSYLCTTMSRSWGREKCFVYIVGLITFL